MRRAQPWRDPGRVAAALVLAGYVGVAFAARNLYPFSVFDMYSRPNRSASRIVARERSGGVAEVERYVDWTCDTPVDTSPDRCGAPGSYFYAPYLDRARAEYVAGHRGTGDGSPVDVVRRIWWLEAPGAPRVEDCVLAHCTAVRR